MTQTQLPSCVIHAFRKLKIPTEGLAQVSPQVVTDTNLGESYFVKTTSLTDVVKRFMGEDESLRALGASVPGLVPKPLGIFNDEGKTVMISEFVDLSHMEPRLEPSLARELANMHDPIRAPCRSQNGMYGFHVPTYCGETEQDNTWSNDWMGFFRDRRIKSLVDRIGDEEITTLGKPICDQVIPFLLTEFAPTAVPVIIHGDLWTGNISVNRKNGQPVLFDPSSYYGHNEVELGIMKMFGGRTDVFFEEYHKHLPKSQPHHEERIRLYELYHYLNHTLIFGGSYRSGAIKIMNELINFVTKKSQG